jgi:hypothetical protein
MILMNTLCFVLSWMRFYSKMFINGGMREFLAAYLPQPLQHILYNNKMDNERTLQRLHCAI